MKPKLPVAFEHLTASWLQRVSELHSYALDLIDLGPATIDTGDISQVIELINKIDTVTDALIATGDSYAQRLSELAPSTVEPPADHPASADAVSLDMSLPPLVKKENLVN